MGREEVQMGDPLGIGANLLAIISAFKYPKELVAKLRSLSRCQKVLTAVFLILVAVPVDSLNQSIYSHYNTGDAQ